MALIRNVKCHENTRLWAYIEYSDENKNHLQVLGSKHFSTKEEAEEYSQGFSIDSYEWIEPSEIRRKRLNNEREKLQKRLSDIEAELTNKK